MSKRKSTKFTWEGISDIKISKEISIPNNLKSVVQKAPKERKEIPAYLQNLRKQNVISSDEVTFLIASGVFA